jgi:putative spermidine/putrescine transport system permease protein
VAVRESNDLSTSARPSFGVALVAWLVLIFLVTPSLIIVPMSFGSDDVLLFPPRKYSLYLYHKFFTETGWVESTVQSLKVGLLATAVALIVGSAAAYGLVRGTFPGRKLLLLFFLTPLFIPLVIMALGFYIYFIILGLNGWSLSLAAAHVIYITPFVVVVVSAALAGVDPTLERAALTMGANRFYVFRRVTLPLIRPGLITAGLFGFLLSFDELIIALFITDPDTKTLPVKMYESLLYEVSPILASVSTMLTALALLACMVAIIFQARTEEKRT